MPGDAHAQEDLAFVREALARSLEGLNRCEAGLRAAQSPAVRALLSGFWREEQARVITALRLLRTMDPTFEESFAEERVASAVSRPPASEEPPSTEVPGSGSSADASVIGAPVLTAPERTLRAGEAPPGAMTGRLTIGSLRRR